MGKERVIEFLRPDDFTKLRSELAVRLSPVSLHNEMGRVRVVFNYAFQNYHIDKPIRYGDGFKRPTKRTLRTAKAKGSKRFFESVEIRTLLKAATDPKLRAMMLLDVNCGLGNADCGNLEQRHLNLDAGWMDYRRPKTGIDRRCWLWPVTVDAIRESLERRTDPEAIAEMNLRAAVNRLVAWLAVQHRLPFADLQEQTKRRYNPFGRVPNRSPQFFKAAARWSGRAIRFFGR